MRNRVINVNEWFMIVKRNKIKRDEGIMLDCWCYDNVVKRQTEVKYVDKWFKSEADVQTNALMVFFFFLLNYLFENV